jgi:hypothetical protein
LKQCGGSLRSACKQRTKPCEGSYNPSQGSFHDEDESAPNKPCEGLNEHYCPVIS